MTELRTRIEPFPDGRTGTCWNKGCPNPAVWTVHLIPPVFNGTLSLMALCDAHLYEFEIDTAEKPNGA